MRRLLFVVCMLIGQPVFAVAQSGTPVGSSAAAFGTGVALARDADAVFWNAALLGIQPFGDVRTMPSGGLRVLSASVGKAPSRGWIDGAARYGLLDGGLRTAPGWTRWVSLQADGATGGQVDFVWIASATGSLAVSLSSHAEAEGKVATVSAGDSTHRAAFTTAMLALGGPAGDFLGVRTRMGVTLKGRWTHVHAAGVWLDSTGSGGAVFRETTLRDVPGVSADIGVVAQPGRFVVSGVVSDAFSMTFRPKRGARARTVIRAGSGDLSEVVGSPIDESDSVSVREAAERLYERSVPPAIARAGVAWSGSWGDPALAVEHRLRSGGLGQEAATRWSASYGLRGDALPLRIGVTGGSGTSGFQAGWISRSCRLPWALAVGRFRQSRDSDMAVAFSLSLGSRSRSTCGAGS